MSTPGKTSTRWLAGLRVATGLIFLWAFVDKLFGLGYATPPAHAWIKGGSPTEGFLHGVNVGPFQSLFHSWSGIAVLDWLFMLGLLGIGLAVTLGVGLRISAVAGTVMLILMWAAEWPPAQTTASGTPSMSTNPLIDYHILYALVLITLAALSAGDTWGFGRRWGAMDFVRRHRWLS